MSIWNRGQRAGIVLGFAGSLLLGSARLMAHEAAGTEKPTSAADAAGMIHAAEEMAAAAHNFWVSLTPEQQAQASFPFDNSERFNWHFIPRERKGLPWKEMKPEQQALAHAFLASGLSRKGYTEAETIMSLEQILKELEQGKGPKRDPENYAFTVFGKPGTKETWGWRVEGHHLSLNFTVVNRRAVAAGPVFFGTNPAEVRQGPRQGLRVLAVEEDLGFDLLKSLTDDQKKKAVVMEKAPEEIITKNDRKANPGAPIGLAVADMNPEQKKLVMTLVEAYAYRLRPELANDDLQKIEKAGADKIYFAWAGAQKMGEGHYYRIHGPTFLVEFDNTQNNANHIHTVWRDATNDFGEDLLKEHYDAHAAGDGHGHDAGGGK